MSGFVHLHVHSQYSINDGAIRVKPLCEEIAKRDVKMVAITDHGVMHGCVDFINKAKPYGIKPILGCEFNVSGCLPDSPEKLFHLTAICRTLDGYKNALALISRANIECYHAETGIGTLKFEWFKDHAQGLTILSGDLGSELAQTVLRDGDIDAVVKQMRDTFEPGEFYLEMMDNSFELQKRVNACYRENSKRWDLPLVATNDCHYLRKDEAFAHAVLVCNSMKKIVDEAELRSFVVDDFYLKTDEEMYSAFKDTPEACENTVKIAESVDCPVRLGPVFLPQYKVPKEFLESHEITDPHTGVHEYFKEVARNGLAKRLESFKASGKSVDEKVYWERLEREIGVITQMDFPGYFLIVWDFIHWAKMHDIPVGPGRGSGAGSLVAYSMTITDLDPLPFSLLFERFLNPERVSMPDFDVDFCMERRTEVIKYVTEHYGVNNVAQIATFGALKAKAALNSVGRVLGFTPQELRNITKFIPDGLMADSHTITLDAALNGSEKQGTKPIKEIRELLDADPRYALLYKTALEVEDLFCQTGMHAAGIVISEGPLWDYVPVFRGANGEIVAQYAKAEVEEAGLVKFDFLGLKTLTVLQYAMRYVNHTREKRGEEPLDLGLIKLDDPNIYRMISQGKTTGVFQLESTGFTKLLTRLKPDCFEDLVAAVALFRPGPMGTGMMDQFVDCKNGLREIEYPHELLSGILKETYGVFVYQEQVMQAAQIMAGYTLGGADIMRRAMGKKKIEEMNKQRAIFVAGSVKKGVEEKRAGEIFDLIAGFAKYGFNKSHSAAYALITYQTAYLKYYYPSELYAALMTCDQDNPAKVIRTINDARNNRIKVLPPDINESQSQFSVDNGCVRFGLAGIKGVGEAALESVFATREKDGVFKSMFDFCERVDLRVNKRVIEALIQSGAFDSLSPIPLRNIIDIGKARAMMFATVQTALDRAKKTREDREKKQTSLFGLFAKDPNVDAVAASAFEERYDKAEPWNENTVLEHEFELIGYFVSGHPLDHYRQECERFASHHTCDLINLPEERRDFKGKQNQRSISLCGILKGATVRNTKSGTKMAEGMLEDMFGQVKFLCFQKTLDKIGTECFATDKPVRMTGWLKVEGGGEDEERKVELFVDGVELLSEVRNRTIEHILFILRSDGEYPENVAERLAHCLESAPGNTQCYLRYIDGDAEASMRIPLKIHLSDELLAEVDQLLGYEAYVIK